MDFIDVKSFVFLLIEEVLNPQYILSKFGKGMLWHKGYRLTMNRKPVVVDGGCKTYWKCTVGGFNKRCRATATTYNVYGVERAIFKGKHNHLPPTPKNLPNFTN